MNGLLGDGWVDEWIKRIDGWMDGQMDGLLNEQMDGYMGEWMNLMDR